MDQADKVVRFVLRLPAALHERLRVLATVERRSLHAQILYLLERAVEAEEEIMEKAAA